MSDKKSSESRRKLLKSIAAGSGAIVAGKSLPDSWSRPVVDSVMLPAHAQTSACTTINVTLAFTRSGEAGGEWEYEIFLASNLGVPIESEDGGISTLNQTDSYTFAPGQYLLYGGSLGGAAPGSSVTVEMSVSCCDGTPVIFSSWSVSPGPGGDDDDGCVLITIGDDGTCQVEATGCPG